jgi:hypothetical protein
MGILFALFDKQSIGKHCNSQRERMCKERYYGLVTIFSRAYIIYSPLFVCKKLDISLVSPLSRMTQLFGL